MACLGMKLGIVLTLGGLGLVLLGCAINYHRLTLECVGPAPGSAADRVAAEGTLIVYSAYTVNADFDRRDIRRPEYSDYRLLAADGTALQRVANNSGTILQGPRLVALPPGEYRVVACANRYGWVTVPVRIKAGLTTIVHLQGGVTWPGQPEFTAATAVRLPDGEIVGWKSDAGSK